MSAYQRERTHHVNYSVSSSTAAIRLNTPASAGTLTLEANLRPVCGKVFKIDASYSIGG